MTYPKPTRRHFTEAARAAAVEARRFKRNNGPPLNTPEVFVVRSDEAHARFRWEVRRFGSVVVGRSACTYATTDAARSAGCDILARPQGQA